MTIKIAVIIGAGPGLGAALAKALSKTHSLLLLSRSLPASLPALNLDLPSSKLIAATSDGSSESLKEAFDKVKETWPEGVVDVGIFNVGGGFSPGPFLEQKEVDFRNRMETNAVGAFNFAQAIIPEMLTGGGTLLFTGATMSLRGGAIFSGMAPGMFARRALSQSLAREFGPKGIHVAHVIIDGGIDSPKVTAFRGEAKNNERLKADDIANVYLDLIRQAPSTWTQEMDLRPMFEKW